MGAIVATLAALLFPVLAQSKRYAKGTVDVSNMRQFYAAVATIAHRFIDKVDCKLHFL